MSCGITEIREYLARHARNSDPWAAAALQLIDSQLAINCEINAAYRDLRARYNALVAELQDLQGELAAPGLGATTAPTARRRKPGEEVPTRQPGGTATHNATADVSDHGCPQPGGGENA